MLGKVNILGNFKHLTFETVDLLNNLIVLISFSFQINSYLSIYSRIDIRDLEEHLATRSLTNVATRRIHFIFINSSRDMIVNLN